MQYYEGIRVRASPAATTHPSQNAVGTNTVTMSSINTTPVKVQPVQQRTVKPISPVGDSTHSDNSNMSVTPRIQAPASPILKAQLSAPPKPSSNAPNQPQNPVTKVDSKSQVGPSPSSLYVIRSCPWFLHHDRNTLYIFSRPLSFAFCFKNASYCSPSFRL